MAPAADPEREHGERVEELLDALETVPAGDREDHLARLCPDPELRREVLRLLAAETEAGNYLESLARELVPKRAEPLDSMTGKRVGAYRLLRPLGRGGMGVVYEAERADGAFEQRVALKLLATALAGTEARDRFLVERQILAGLGHPAITRIVDGGVSEDGMPWFAMERVEGTPIDAYCGQLRLGIRERLELFLQVCDAVEHAHRRLVVHGDLKPANVLVSADRQVKLLDFGIARLLEPEAMAGTAHPTHTGLRMMTPEYASPEQVRGDTVTTASDVYQLGLLLYELLTGLRPYAQRHRDEDKRERRRLRGDLDAIVLEALRKEPERRYGSADRLAQDIRRHLDGRPVAARSDTWIYRGRKFLERHALGASAAAIALVLATGMASFYTVRIQSERDRAKMERDRAQTAHARARAENERAQAEAAKAQQMSQFLASLFRSADPREARGTELTARELLDRGVERVDVELAAQPEIQASMLQVLGRTYSQLSIYDSAERLLTRALELRRGELGPESPEVAEILGDIGTLRYRQGEFDRARRRLDEAIRIIESSRGEAAPELSPLLSSQGHVYRILGEYGRAQAALERALAIQTRASGEDSVLAANMMSRLAALLIETDALARAENLLQRTLVVYERELGVDHPSVGIVLTNLASARLHQGSLEGVEAMYRRSLSILQNAYGPVHPEVGMALNNLGNFLIESEQDDEAIQVLERALQVYSEALGRDHPRVAYPLTSLGDAHFASGRLREARRHYQRSVAIRRQALEASKFDRVLAHGLVRLGGIEAELGDSAAAERTLNHALEMWSEAPETTDPGLAPTLIELGRWAAEQRRCTEAVSLLRRALRLQTARQHTSSADTVELQSLLAECGAPAATSFYRAEPDAKRTRPTRSSRGR